MGNGVVGAVFLYSNLGRPHRTPEELASLTAIVRDGTLRPIDKFRIDNVTRRLGTEKIAELIADYQSGISSGELTTKYALAKGTVLRLLEDEGVLRQRQSLSDSQVVNLVSGYVDDKKSIAKLAAESGIAGTTIRRALISAGVEMRPRGWPHP